MKEFTFGVGFRKDFAGEFLESNKIDVDFVELAPENWAGIGGHWKRIIRRLAEKYPLICHGLSLSIGSPEPLDFDFLKQVKSFIEEFEISIYSEHMSFCKCDNTHLYDLLPIPFKQDAIKHTVERIKQVQDFLGRQIVLENISYYTQVDAEMDEATFLRTIMEEADCKWLMDVNNVYVNSFNHKYDAREFIDSMPTERVAYIHMAGHRQVSDDLIIDTHGEDIIDEVYELFDYAVQKIEPVPVLLERDFNIPTLSDLNKEVNNLRAIARRHAPTKKVA